MKKSDKEKLPIVNLVTRIHLRKERQTAVVIYNLFVLCLNYVANIFFFICQGSFRFANPN